MLSAASPGRDVTLAASAVGIQPVTLELPGSRERCVYSEACDHLGRPGPRSIDLHLGQKAPNGGSRA
jgi:hypothetical protein